MSAGAVRLHPRSESIEVRGLRYHVRHWGSEGATRVLMLHGWMDVGASFQFLVDAMEHDWHIIAPDWRGFGRTQWAPHGYWFADYLADLDALIDRYSPAAPIRLVGHSLGGNVVMLYAGLRPQRVCRVVSLEGFGVRDSEPDALVGRFREWLDGQGGGPKWSDFASLDQVAERLRKNSPRLSIERARVLAREWSASDAQGRWRLLADPAHRLPFPTAYRFSDTLPIWGCIGCPVLWVEASDSHIRGWLGAGEIERRADALNAFGMADCRITRIDDAGHMLHLEQPEAVVRAIEPFLVQ